jgi:hypothetical protein
VVVEALVPQGPLAQVDVPSNWRKQLRDILLGIRNQSSSHELKQLMELKEGFAILKQAASDFL